MKGLTPANLLEGLVTAGHGQNAVRCLARVGIENPERLVKVIVQVKMLNKLMMTDCLYIG